MTERNIRRAVERKARKEAYKAQKAALRAAAVSASANNNNNDDDPPIERKPNERSPLVDWDKLETYTGPRVYPDRKKYLLTQARLEANRTNSEHSTGPVSDAGKAISSQNARTHGLASVDTNFSILECEDAEAYQALRQQLIDEHKPQTPTEALLVEHMSQHNWLRERALRLQNSCFDQQSGDILDVKKFELFERYATRHEKAFYQRLAALGKLRKDKAWEDDRFVQKRDEKIFREIRAEVEKTCDGFREKGDWSEYWPEVLRIRDQFKKKYRPEG